jgi:RNA polymerase sigma-70 factor (ECF subfamily)
MSVVSSSEKETLERLANGSEVGFEELVIQFERKIYSLCLSLLQNSAEAEFVLSEVFCRAFDELPEATENGIAPVIWLYRTAIEVAAERELLRHPEFDSSAGARMLEILSSAVEQHYDETGNEEGLFKTALSTLPYEYRAVYLLHESLGMTVSDITEILCVSELETRAFLHRARLMICRYLQKFRSSTGAAAHFTVASLKRNSAHELLS